MDKRSIVRYPTPFGEIIPFHKKKLKHENQAGNTAQRKNSCTKNNNKEIKTKTTTLDVH